VSVLVEIEDWTFVGFGFVLLSHEIVLLQFGSIKNVCQLLLASALLNCLLKLLMLLQIFLV
jgi:hypothetical protein